MSRSADAAPADDAALWEHLARFTGANVTHDAHELHSRRTMKTTTCDVVSAAWSAMPGLRIKCGAS